MNIYLIQVMIQYYFFLLKLFYLWQLGAFELAPEPLCHSYQQYVCLFIGEEGSEYGLNFLAPQNSPGSSGMLPAPVLEPAISPRCPGSSY